MTQNDVRLLTKKEAAQYLGISESCVVNWIRLKYIVPYKAAQVSETQKKRRRERIFFPESDVQDLKHRLESGDFAHLRSRANKTFSSRSAIPQKLLLSFSVEVRCLTSFIAQSGLEPPAALYFLAVALFCRSGDLSQKNLKNLCSAALPTASRSGVLTVLAQFYALFSEKITKAESQAVFRLLDWDIPDEEDVLGSVYQLLAGNDEKARRGLFYTPLQIAASIVPDPCSTAVRLLDPCCGTGRLLLRCAERVTDPRCLYGVDVDPVAVFAAAVNLLLHFPAVDFTPNLVCADFLADPPPFTQQFDCLITNPPWGAKQGLQQNTFGGETFAQVIARGADCLKPGGSFALVLPESFLNVKKHEEIRRFLLEQFSLREIRLWGNCFPGVFSRAVTLKMHKNPSFVSETLFVYENKAESRVVQGTFSQNISAVFSLFLTDADRTICEKVRGVTHQTLLHNARWAIGIVTGNNRKFLLRTREDGAEPICSGRDVFPFRLTESGFYLRFTPALFQQTALEEKYRAPEKLIYRFISRRLIFAYDNKQRLTLNSANIVIPSLHSCPIKAVAALFNSDLYAFYYQKNFQSLKVLRYALESLPLPILTKEQQESLCELADELAQAEKNQLRLNTQSFARLNAYVYDFFGISEEERRIIELFLAE